jgi:hypothetical protein
MGVNVLSNDVGYRGVAAAVAAGAVLTATSWLRRLPPRAPLVRYVVRILLVLCLAGAVVAAIGPTSWAAPLTLTTAALTAAAVLISNDAGAARTLLFGLALIGAGVALVGLAVRLDLVRGDALAGITGVGAGMALIGLGVTVLVGDRVLFEMARVGTGVALVGGGFAASTEGDGMIGAALIGLGVGVVVYGVAKWNESDAPAVVALIGGGVALIVGGVGASVMGSALLGVAVSGAGVTAIGLGVTGLTKAGVKERLRTWVVAATRDSASPRESPMMEDEASARRP